MEEGAAVTDAPIPVEGVKPVVGVQAYEAYGVVPPDAEAVRVTPLVPEQNDTSSPADTVGFGLTVTVMVLEIEHSSASVTTTV